MHVTQDHYQVVQDTLQQQIRCFCCTKHHIWSKHQRQRRNKVRNLPNPWPVTHFFCLCRCFLKSLYDLIRTTLQCIPNLEFLGLFLFDFDSSAILDNCTFPRIRTLRSHQHIDGSLASFLQRHPTLDRLELTNVPSLYPQLFVDISLSSLTDFYGPCDLLPMFQNGCSIRSATILWLAGAQIQNPLGLLPYFTSSGYRLNYNRPDWSIELASVITQYIPDVSTLKMREYVPK